MMVDDRQARISTLEECLQAMEATSEDDSQAYTALMDELTAMKKDGLKPGSSEWVAVVVGAEQRSEAFHKARQQRALQRSQALLRDRERAENKAVLHN